MKSKTVESELNSENRNSVPILAPGIGTRIKQVASLIGTRADAAKAGGVSTDMLYRYIREESPPSFTAMAGLAKAAGVSLDWLATGEGPVRPGERVEPEFNEDEFALVPLYDVEVSAGHGTHVDYEPVKAKIAFRRDWLAQSGFNINNLVSLTARGDSMEPTVRDGDLLLVDTSQTEVVEDGIYVLRLDHHLLAKRLQRLFDGTIYIKSDNPAYERQVVSKEAADQLHVIGRVVWAGKRM